MAVAAHEAAVYVYALKPMEVMNKEVQDGLGLRPIREVSWGRDFVLRPW